MAILLTGTTIGGHSAIHAGNLATHGIITTSNIGSYAITSIPTSFSSITVTSSFDTASNDIYASMRVIRNNSAITDGMYIGYGNSGSGITRIFGGGSTTGALVKATDYTYEPGSFRAPIFYDSDNTTYYFDGNSTTSLRTRGSWRSDSSDWDGEFSGKIQYHSSNWYIQAADSLLYRNAGGTNVFLVNQAGDATAVGSMRSPIFYDSNDTSYYVDPNGLSVLSHIRLNNNWANGGINQGAINIRGQYPSMIFRNTVSDSMWLRHMDGSGTIQHYYASDGVDSSNWSIKHSMHGNGNFSSIGTHTASQFIGSGAGLTGTASSLSVGYATTAGSLSSMNISQFTNNSGYITGYTETDTLNSVTGRGNTTSNSVRFGSHVDLSSTGSAFRFYDGSTFRGGFGLDSWGHAGSDANLVLYVNGDNTLFFSTAGTKRASLSSTAFNSLVALQQSGNQVLHAGNYTSYSPSLTGSGASGTWNINVTGSAGSASTAGSATNLYGTGGSSIQSTSTGTSYTANYQVRENAGGSGNTNEIYAPQLAFHWGGVVASSIMMESSGRMAIRNNPGGSYENFIAAVIYSSGYGDSTQWNTAYSWGNHASAGYLTSGSLSGYATQSYVNSQGFLTSVPAQSQLISPNGATVVAADAAMPNAGHSFIHSLALGPGGNDGHILGMTWAGTTSIYGAQIFLDTDPNDIMAIRSRSSGGVWTSWKTVYHTGNFTNNSSNWDTAYSWGNHASAGYLTGAHNHDDRYYTESESDSRYLYYRGYSTSGNTQNFQSIANTIRFDQVGALDNGAWSNQPTGYYTYGGILSLRGESFGLQIYGSHTGDLVFKTQWDNDQYSGWRTVIHSANIGSQSVSYASTAGSLTSMNISQFTNNSGYLTSLPSHNHDDRYLVKGGGWYGVNLPGSRWGGFAVDGGEIAFGNGLPNANQMGILIDGAYLAGENNGFWSLPSDNNWNGRRGMSWNGTYLDFTTNSPTAQFTNLRLANGFEFQQGGADYGRFSSWVNLNGYYGLYSGLNGAHIFPNNGTYGAWKIIGTRNGYGGIEFETSNGNLVLMISTDSNSVGFHNNSYGWQTLWQNGTLYVYKNSYGGGTQATVLDSSNYSSYAQPAATAINTSNIGSQSVSYASSAGSVAWTNVSSRPTALSQFTNDLGNYGGWLTTGGKAADSELIDGIDSSRIVFGDGARASTYVSSMDDPNQKSGFFFKDSPTGQPFGDWWNWMTVAGNSWQSSNNYSFQIAHAFHSDDAYIRRMTNGTAYSWRTLITSGNIGSQSVNYANSAGSATSATNAGQLNTYGYLVGENWNTYYTSGKLRVASVSGSTSIGAPPSSVHNFGSLVSYGISGEDMFQMYFPDNAGNSIANSRKLHYRTGRTAWCDWRTVVDMVGDTLTIVEGGTPKIVVRGSVPYGQPTSASIELVGDADGGQTQSYRWISTAPDWGGQEFRLERKVNNSFQLVGRVPKNTFNLEWQGTIVQGLSDSRVKTNVVSMTEGLDKIDRIRPVTFDWVPTEDVSDREGADFGFIAQELEEVLPEVVHTRGDGYKTVMYEKVVPVLVQAMKEQQAMIDALKAEIELLKNK